MTSTARHTAPEPPVAGGMLEQVGPLVGFIAQAGPPPFILGGALVVGALLLAGPFALAVTLVLAVALVAASVAVLAGAVVAIVAAPFVLARLARRSWMAHSFSPVGHRARPTSALIAGRIR